MRVWGDLCIHMYVCMYVCTYAESEHCKPKSTSSTAPLLRVLRICWMQRSSQFKVFHWLFVPSHLFLPLSFRPVSPPLYQYNNVQNCA